MNPVALQIAKGGPYAPTSWGAFGPYWLWVSPAAVPSGNVAVGQVVERETANPISPLIGRTVAVGQASEAETANPITILAPRQVLIGRATEIELGRTITPVVAMPIFVPVQTAVERELARIITPTKNVPGQIGVTCQVLSPTVICEVEV